MESEIPEWEEPRDRARLADLAGLLARVAELEQEGWHELAGLLLERAAVLEHALGGAWGVWELSRPSGCAELDAAIEAAELHRRMEIRCAPFRTGGAPPEFEPEPWAF